MKTINQYEVDIRGEFPTQFENPIISKSAFSLVTAFPQGEEAWIGYDTKERTFLIRVGEGSYGSDSPSDICDFLYTSCKSARNSFFQELEDSCYNILKIAEKVASLESKDFVLFKCLVSPFQKGSSHPFDLIIDGDHCSAGRFKEIMDCPELDSLEVLYRGILTPRVLSNLKIKAINLGLDSVLVRDLEDQEESPPVLIEF